MATDTNQAKDRAEATADEIINTITDDLMHRAIDSRGDNTDKGLRALVLTVELETRKPGASAPPKHIDPREQLDVNHYVDAVDDLLRGIADDLHDQMDAIDDPERREHLRDVIAELDTRIRGGQA
ncbi:hypothetical protein [Halorussus sp. AFM4]|uniref:hypothetical protein n=1 Tax=Halorussus sp. AFM4 TaxID=3421651 RepID=UPI003EBFED23